MDDDMLKEFVVEAMDLAVNVEENLLRLERDPENKETLMGGPAMPAVALDQDKVDDLLADLGF